MTTIQQINNLIEFRQAIFDLGLTKNKDALFELIDALIERPHLSCFAELSLSPIFQRRWSSAYKAVKRGGVNQQKLEEIYASQIPPTGIQKIAVDSTFWIHKESRTLEGLVYGMSPTKALKKHCVVQGHEYSALSWIEAPGQSWGMPLSTKRIVPEKSSLEVGIEQVKAFCQKRQACDSKALDVFIGDGHYGNSAFWKEFQDELCAIVVRLRRNRIMYLPAPKPEGPKRGRPRKHGPKMAFKDPQSWPEPSECVEFKDERWGKVTIRRWDNLHDQQHPEASISVLGVWVHQENPSPTAPLWLGYKPGYRDVSAQEIWSWFSWRWPIEPSIRFRKQQLAWTRPAFQDSASCDHWTDLTQAAFWMLYLARPLVADHHLPWQKPALSLTPLRVKRAFPSIFCWIGSPTTPPQSRGKSAGWQKGRGRQRKKRHKAVKRRRFKPSKQEFA